LSETRRECILFSKFKDSGNLMVTLSKFEHDAYGGGIKTIKKNYSTVSRHPNA